MRQELNKIRPMLERVIEAISSVVRVDITITDAALNRIASTGQYIKHFDSVIEHQSVFGYVLEQKRPLFIDNPRENDVCVHCKNKDNCKEYAEVCCPIILEDEIIGAIGLVAFDKEQQQEILNNQEHLIDFLENMAALIASKISEERKREQIDLQTREVEVLIDYIDNGVVSIDNVGRLIRYNKISDQLFSIAKRGVKHIKEIIGECDLKELLNPDYIVGNHHFDCVCNDRYRAFIYSGKPIFYDNQVVEVVISFRQKENIITEVNALLGQPLQTTFEDILGDSIALQAVKMKGLKAAKSISSVLIRGQSGTGKELFARAIHYDSERRDKPFIAINCAAIPENLLESELFGYEEGAFSGAKIGGKLGKFELADKGTLFLDEIGDMPIHLQAKLLRVLQERVVERVGGKYGIPIDVRLISATNKPLEELVEQGQFREDLYYRLNVIPLNIPSLKERPSDISLLVKHFTKRFNQKLNKNISGCREEVIDLLRLHPWKGNVRELENMIEYSVNMCSRQWIEISDLPQSMKINTPSHPDRPIMNFKELEKLELQRALEKFGRHKKGVEDILNATGLSRATFYRKIKEYKL